MLQGMPRVDHVKQFCDTCILTMQRWFPFPSQASSMPRRSWSSCTATSAGP
jgi:hypothetical protein